MSVARHHRSPVLLLLFALGSLHPVRSGAAPPDAGTGAPGATRKPALRAPRLYVLDCGTLLSGSAEEYGLARNEVADPNMAGAPGPPPPELAALAKARKRVIQGDHDVFGDGTVLLLSTPGHTPGHQSLYVKLVRTGGVVISGDLYHHDEERTLDRMPAEERTTGTPESRRKIETVLSRKKARLWIGHSTAFFRDAVKAPRWYE
ncbi:MAG: MBL fold metallo-hydrolase [Myxococcaceae bacterium]|nr:MAG: MBL fold metallo-hydrolase [Myxococcaceae bacterium]